jgi:hypothetical protein
MLGNVMQDTSLQSYTDVALVLIDLGHKTNVLRSMFDFLYTGRDAEQKEDALTRYT